MRNAVRFLLIPPAKKFWSLLYSTEPVHCLGSIEQEVVEKINHRFLVAIQRLTIAFLSMRSLTIKILAAGNALFTDIMESILIF